MEEIHPRNVSTSRSADCLMCSTNVPTSTSFQVPTLSLARPYMGSSSSLLMQLPYRSLHSSRRRQRGRLASRGLAALSPPAVNLLLGELDDVVTRVDRIFPTFRSPLVTTQHRPPFQCSVAGVHVRRFPPNVLQTFVLFILPTVIINLVIFVFTVLFHVPTFVFTPV